MVEEIEIDYATLKPFIDEMLRLFDKSNNTALYAMTSGITEVLLALEANITGDTDLRKGSKRTASLIERSKLIFYDLEMYLKQANGKG